MPSYDILIEAGLFDQFEALIKDINHGQSLFVITDEHVFGLYEKHLKNALKNVPHHILTTPEGEHSKSLKNYEHLIHQLIELNIKRDDLIVAFGGGVIGDLAGFIASTLYRGIAYIQVPTTLLAMVDSSIGAKTGINLSVGKNLLGSFYPPKRVIIDPNFLKTLAKDEYQNGVAEMIKVGLIGDSELFEDLKTYDEVNIRDIERAILVKKSFVLKDPYDKGERMFLNFGHTYGHAIENKHDYETYKHGVAISYGMLMALKYGVKQGITPPELYDHLLELFLKKGLVKEPLLNHKDYIPYLKLDKKNLQGGLRFIVIKEIGTPLIITIKQEEL